jgi:glutamate synthase (NADPH/NADH) small chain
MSTQFKPGRVRPFPFPKEDPEKRTKNFEEVQVPYTRLEVIQEASRCLLCGTPVCIDACPVQMDVRGMCEAVSQGDFSTAYARIRDTNALLGVTARCCPQLQSLCENACVMRWGGEAISIGMIQRFVSDWESNGDSRQADPQRAPESGKRVSIVGSGPSGLAAADLLRRYGHGVIIYEELPNPGGTAWYGIPDYHLPKNVLQYEIERIKGEGVEIKTNVKVGKDVMLSDLLAQSDAVLVTTGPKDVNKLDTPGIDLKGVHDGYQFLEDVFVNGVEEYMKHPKYDLGSDILVIGAGDSALDDARVAKRLTGGNVTIVYRRTEEDAPSDPVMVDEAKEEGIQFRYLANPKKYNGENGKLVSTTMDTMQLGAEDASGRRSPEPVPGKEFEMKSSAVLLAVGRGPNSFLQKQAGLKMGRKNSIAVDDHFRTSMHGVFAAGDVTTGETLVVKAMGSGRDAAQRIHEYLSGIAEEQHVSLYERYFVQRSFETMMRGQELKPPPP